jgi:hypothetical protein
LLLENLEDPEESTKFTGGAVGIAGTMAGGGIETSGALACEE